MFKKIIIIIAGAALWAAGLAWGVSGPSLSAETSGESSAVIHASWDYGKGESGCKIRWGSGDPVSGSANEHGLGSGQSSADLQATPGTHYNVAVGVNVTGATSSTQGCNSWSSNGVDVPAWNPPPPPPPPPPSTTTDTTPTTTDTTPTTTDTMTTDTTPTTTTDPTTMPAPAVPAPQAATVTVSTQGGKRTLSSAISQAVGFQVTITSHTQFYIKGKHATRAAVRKVLAKAHRITIIGVRQHRGGPFLATKIYVR